MGMRRSFRPTNIIVGGNFPSVVGWSAGGGIGSVSSNIYSLIGNGTSQFVSVLTTTAIPCVSGRKIYFTAKNWVTNPSAVSIFYRLDGSVGGGGAIETINTPTSGALYKYSSITTLDGTYTGNVRFTLYHRYADAAAANGKEMKIQEVMAIDISTLPAEIQAMSDANIKLFCEKIPWFDGTMSGGKMGGTGGLK